MKLLRKLFGKKDNAEKKVEANEKALKKRNVKRGVGAAISLGASAYVGKTTGDIASHIAAEKEVVEKLGKASQLLGEKAMKGSLNEREAELKNAIDQKFRQNPKVTAEEVHNFVRKNSAVTKNAEKAGKKAKLATGLLVGGALAAHTAIAYTKAAKKDKKQTEEKNKNMKKKAKKFSKVGEAGKKIVRGGFKAGKKYIKEFDHGDYNNLKSAKDALNIQRKDDKQKEFSGREKVSKSILKEAKKSGVIQKDASGNWRIISMKSGEYWNAKYETREKAEKALAAYHANRH